MWKRNVMSLFISRPKTAEVCGKAVIVRSLNIKRPEYRLIFYGPIETSVLVYLRLQPNRNHRFLTGSFDSITIEETRDPEERLQAAAAEQAEAAKRWI